MAGILRLIWYEDEAKVPRALEGTIDVRTKLALDAYREDARSIILQGTTFELGKAIRTHYEGGE